MILYWVFPFSMKRKTRGQYPLDEITSLAALFKANCAAYPGKLASMQVWDSIFGANTFRAKTVFNAIR
jgi:hypothetical protein